MEPTLLIGLAGAAVLVPALFGVGRAWTYAMLGFACTVLGGLLIVATPTPSGFHSNLESNRWVVSTRVGQDAGAALFVAGAVGLVTAFMVSGRE